MDTEVRRINDDLFIITENYIGQLYTIRCAYVRDLIEDWESCVSDYHGDSKWCPRKDARVFFASWNNHPFNPHDYKDFGGFMEMLIKWCS